jgi:hypothetical protein
MKKWILLLFMTILLFSCYYQKITLNSDKKSGQIYIEYRLTDEYFQVLSVAMSNFTSTSSSKNQFDPAILLDEESFKTTVNGYKGLKLISISINKTSGYYGKALIQFDDFVTLLDELPRDLINLSVIKDNNNVTLSQIFNFKQMDPNGTFKNFVQQQKEDDPKFYDKLTKETVFNFVVASANPFKKTEGVNVSENKKEASYSFKLNDFITNDDKTLKFILSL